MDDNDNNFNEGPAALFTPLIKPLSMAEIVDKATFNLERFRPEYSAHIQTPFGIKLCLLSLFCGLIYLSFFHPTILLWITIFLCISLALHSCIGIFDPPRAPPDLSNPPKNLPSYTILLPLFQEAHMIGQLLQNMHQLVYPKDKIQILILVEANDSETSKEATRLALSSEFSNHFGELRVINVPKGDIQTKPRACNVGIHYARGDLLCVYDAEDAPAPYQLIEAATAFRDLGSKYMCLQAPLIIQDKNYDVLGHIMGLEYDTLFRQYLPGIEKLGLPIPLGGTSNHFRTHALKEMYGWDVFNVTEDADIGIRLREEGYYTSTLYYGTVETATRGLRAHISQRTRWQKGNLQTWLVRLRNPINMISKIGVLAFLSFQLIFIGRSFAPIIYINMIIIVLQNFIVSKFLDKISIAISLIGISMIFATHIICAIKLKRNEHIFYLPFLPAFWALSTFIFFRAVTQLITDPFRWDKTLHHTKEI